jgi:hypothetical protein
LRQARAKPIKKNGARDIRLFLEKDEAKGCYRLWSEKSGREPEVLEDVATFEEAMFDIQELIKNIPKRSWRWWFDEEASTTAP